jgi:hypothetical protein
MHAYRPEGTVGSSYNCFWLHPPVDLCIASYCDNSSLLKYKEDLHIRDTDSPRLNTKPELRTFHSDLPRRTVVAIKVKRVISMSSPCQHNHLATNALMDLCEAEKY